MDIPIKFTIKKRAGQNIQFRTYEGDIDTSKSGSILFEFNEYEEVYIKFDYDKNNGRIFIDTYNDDSKIICNPDEEILLNLPMRENSLVPGDFEIKIDYKYNIICYFRVQPKNLEWCELINLRQILDKYIKGICINFNLSKNSNNYKSSDDILYYYQNQYNLWQEIKWSIKLIINKPDGENEKVYGYYNKQNKMDMRTIKAINKKSRDKLSPKHYTYQQSINYNISDNIMLYNSLQEYRDILKKNYVNIKKLYITEDEKLNDIKYQYIMKQIELINIKNNNILSDRYKSSIENRVNYLRKSEYIQIEKLKVIENLNNMLNKTTIEVEDIIFEIQKKLTLNKFGRNTISSIKNLRYKSIIDMLNTIIEIKNYEHDSLNKEDALIFRFKKTEVLFEYLCFIRVIEVLLCMGYVCEAGWFQKVINQEYDMEIPSECDNYFKKENITIVVSYDKEAPNIIEDSYEGLYSFNSRHRRPDISVLIYKGGTFIKALILEVKYRNSKYIYSNQGDTGVIDTMKDYSQLCYYKGKLKRDAIDRVITLYPNQKNNISLEKNELIDIFSFIPIDVSSDNIESELYIEIERFIDEYAN